MNNEPNTLGTLSILLALVNGAFLGANNAVGLAKASGNHELKNSVNDILDSLLDIKVKVIALGEENTQYREINRVLEARIRERASVKRNSEFGYYYQDGDVDPLCPKCYESDAHRLSHLSGLVFINPYMGRECCQCGWVSSEYREKSGDFVLAGEPSVYALSRGYGS